jgi:hypothetical protein
MPERTAKQTIISLSAIASQAANRLGDGFLSRVSVERPKRRGSRLAACRAKKLLHLRVLELAHSAVEQPGRTDHPLARQVLPNGFGGFLAVRDRTHGQPAFANDVPACKNSREPRAAGLRVDLHAVRGRVDPHRVRRAGLQFAGRQEDHAELLAISSSRMVIPTLVRSLNVTPSLAICAISAFSTARGRARSVTAYRNMPPGSSCSSKTVQSKPCRWREYAADKPAGPAPTIATF